MWFYPLLILLVVLAIVGGTLAGGIFTIVLIPLAVIALVSAVVYAMWGRSMQAQAGATADATVAKSEPLPHQRRRPTGRTATSPEALADARRQQQ